MPATTERPLLLTDAAIALIAGSGIRSLTHRAVDAAADVPTGTTSYHFRTRRELLRGVLLRIAAINEERLARLPGRRPTRPAPPPPVPSGWPRRISWRPGPRCSSTDRSVSTGRARWPGWPARSRSRPTGPARDPALRRHLPHPGDRRGHPARRHRPGTEGRRADRGAGRASVRPVGRGGIAVRGTGRDGAVTGRDRRGGAVLPDRVGAGLIRQLGAMTSSPVARAAPAWRRS